MKKDALVISFFTIWVLLISSFVLKYLGEVNFRYELTLLSFFISILFIYLVIKEVSKSTSIERHEKRMWIIGIIFMSSLLGWIYIFSARKRIVQAST
ncbi:MAG: hypothetical protein KGZ59_04125 [Chitinophagaceae bacterium]|nr:hypothetical protein [Chitinophagaceae bacterium]